MNCDSHPFDPSCKPQFAERAYRAVEPYCSDSRGLFYYLLFAGEYYDVLPLAYDFVKEALQSVYDAENVAADKPEPLNAAFALRQFAPVLLTEACWLENVTQTATGDTPIAARLMGVHLRLTQDRPNPPERFRNLLCDLDIPLPALATWEFTQLRDIDDSVFDFAAMQLALAQFPRGFLPEILGFSLAYCEMSGALLKLIDATETETAVLEYLALRQRAAEAETGVLKQTVADYLALFPEQHDVIRQRIETGGRLYRRLFERCINRLQQLQTDTQTPRAALIAMLRNKAPFAFGHHGRILLQGKGLDEWFTTTPFDGDGFLAALRQSGYIDLQQPRASSLFRLFEFGGPMFGVFNEDEIKLFEAWLEAERQGFNEPSPTAAPARPLTTVFDAPLEHFHTAYRGQVHRLVANEFAPTPPTRAEAIPETYAKQSYAGLNNRKLYYYLQNAELFPDVLPTAKKRAQKVLHYAKYLYRLPFAAYNHQCFEAHLQRVYAREMNNYRPLDRPPKLSRETYRWGIEQFAPTILTDGSWLQHSVNLCRYAQPDVGKLLYRIFCDEGGAGHLEQNHPLIYRRLLESLDIRLPPTHSRAFIEHPGFVARAFDLPVYLMSIAAFPNEFLPELLGLNLAIELSGLGRFYMRLAEALEYWGIDASIVKVHISADNFASGHAAMAKQAVQIHLDEILAVADKQEMQRQWRRIYTGYTSLGVAVFPFIGSLALRCFPRILLGRK